mgnify:CR=1 FL=1
MIDLLRVRNALRAILVLIDTTIPIELYVKFLAEIFESNIDYDPDTISEMPLKKFKYLSHQMNDGNTGYGLRVKNYVIFLAYYVGTGKTVLVAVVHI